MRPKCSLPDCIATNGSTLTNSFIFIHGSIKEFVVLSDDPSTLDELGEFKVIDSGLMIKWTVTIDSLKG